MTEATGRPVTQSNPRLRPPAHSAAYMHGGRDMLSSLNCALEWAFYVAVRRFVFSAADRLCCRLPAGSQLQHVGLPPR